MKGRTMTTAIVKQEGAPIAARLEFSDDQRLMIRDMYAKGATDQEFSVLLEIASVRRLNPLLKQIHFVKRWDGKLKREVWAAQVSIDGLRAIAERTGRYDGQDEPEYIYENNKLVCAKVKVYRKDWGRPAVGVAHWNEFVQTTKEGGPTRFWQQMPHVMLAKCAEAAGHRKAFPEDTSGLYIPEEMGQAENTVPVRQVATTVIEEPAQLVQNTATDDPTPWFDRIAEAVDMSELGTIAEFLKDLNFSMLDRKELRDAWGARREDLRRKPKQQREPGDDEEMADGPA
jgi:phage recombination protein Bet